MTFYGSNNNFAGTSTVTGVTKRAQTKEMDKTFDFSDFTKKKFEMSPTLEATSNNTITDEVIHTGLLKTLIMAGNGVFEYSVSNFGYAIQKAHGIGDFNGLGPSYPSLADGIFVTHNNYEKLPRKALETVLEWYRRVQAKNGEEAQVNFYYNEHGRTHVQDENGNDVELSSITGVKFWSDKLFSYTPKQWNSSTLTEVADDHYYEEFNRVFGMYVETHSHNSMDAFASGTDIANSANDGFQLVFGHFGTDKVEMYSWATASQIVKEGLSTTDLDFILEKNPDATWRPEAFKYDIPVSSFDYDESVFDVWDNQVEIRPVRTTVTSYASYAEYDDYGYGYGAAKWKKSSWAAKPRYVAPTEAETIENIFSEFDFSEAGNITVTIDSLWDVLRDAYSLGYQERKTNPVYGTRTESLQIRFENRVRNHAKTFEALIQDAQSQIEDTE